MIYEKLVPKEHLLIKIDDIIEFSFIYDKLADRYSPIGRDSEDPAMMTKILLQRDCKGMHKKGLGKQKTTYH